MDLLKIEGVRYILFGIFLLILLALNSLSISVFFIGSALFVILNYFIDKKTSFNKSIKNIYFNIFFVAFVIFTVILINYQLSWN
jgi:hypothetical protein